MKRLFTLLIACLLTVGLLGSLSVSAAGSLSVTASATTVTVGQNVTVTLRYDGGGQPIAGIDCRLTYDTNVFSYVSFTGEDVEKKGDAGIIDFLYGASGAEAPTAVTITVTLCANAPGSSNFAVTTDEFINDTDYSSLGEPTGSVTVTANNPTLSANADLKSLVPSRGTLTPKFDPAVTSYTISVANSVTSLSLSAVAAEGKVTSISGKNALVVGKNTRVITVTAPNGTTKTYTVVITRAAAPSTTSGNKPTTGTTAPQPPEDALEVSIGGKPMTILDTQASVDLPDGFSWSNVTINLVEVPAAVHAQTGMTLLYLVSEGGEDNGFYVYDVDADTFAKFRLLEIAGRGWLLYDLPGDKAPAGTTVGTLVYEGGSISAYVYEDADLRDFCIVWAAPTDGEAAWYTYDTKEGTLQRYHATPVGGTATAPSTNHQTNATTPADSTETEEDTSALSRLLNNYRQPVLIGIVAVAGVAIVVIIIMMLSAGGRKKGKHRKGKH